MYDNIVEKLYQEYSQHGFISEESIFNFLEENSISLLDSDTIVDRLLSKGVIIRDEPQTDSEDDYDDYDDYDKGHYDYEEIFKTVLEMDPELSDLIKHVQNIKPPQHREWQVLLPQAKSGNEFARNRLFEMYMRSAIRIALQFSVRYNQPLSDTIQNGFIGLFISIDKFEYGRQDNFPQYYPLWVIQNIRRELQPFNPTVYYPAHVIDKMFTTFEVVKNHNCNCCCSDRICKNLLLEVKESLNCTEEEAVKLIESLKPFESLSQFSSDDENFAFIDEECSVERIIETKDFEMLMNEALDTLNEREKNVICLRFGFADGISHTLEEVGAKYKVTRERIRQIETNAICKLRHPVRSEKFKAYYE